MDHVKIQKWVRPVCPGDRTRWESMFEAYARFGRQDQTAEMRARVWDWVQNPDGQVFCNIAGTDEAGAVGFIHFRAYERPLPATIGCYIDDMFVCSSARGLGLAELLIESVCDSASQNGRDVVRWMTSETNYRARALYDRIGFKTKWITYQAGENSTDLTGEKSHR